LQNYNKIIIIKKYQKGFKKDFQTECQHSFFSCIFLGNRLRYGKLSITEVMETI